MNKYTIGKATQGLGKYLLDTFGVDECRSRGVVVGYDTRNNSKFFADVSASVLSSMGIRVRVHSSARPTPQLSFSVKHLNALAGVVITASHNPKEYNGYKVYDEYGCQLVPDKAERVIGYVNAVDDYGKISFNGDKSLIETVDVTDEFVNAALRQSRYGDAAAKAALRVVYTPLQGNYRLMTGNQVGALLMNFILRHTDLSKYNRPAVVKTVVTSELGAEITRKNGISVFQRSRFQIYRGEDNAV